MTSSVVSMPASSQHETILEQRPLRAFAPPSILGMYAFATAAFLVGARMAHWYGDPHSAAVLFPLVLIFGGLVQFYASGWAFQSRDAIAMAMHGTWGAFWTAFGVLEILYTTGLAVRPSGAFPELGFWFIAMAAITWAITLASRDRQGMATVLGLLAIASTIEAVAELAGIAGLRFLAAYFLMASAVVAWYVGSALMMRFVRTDNRPLLRPAEKNEAGRAA